MIVYLLKIFIQLIKTPAKVSFVALPVFLVLKQIGTAWKKQTFDNGRYE